MGRCTGRTPLTLRAMRKRNVSYYDYLKSEAWKRKRAEARRRSHGKCRVCGTTKNLHTHHKTYKRLGNETQRDLVMLCATHHQGCHDFINHWRAKGWKPKSDYALTMKYIARERAKLRKK